MVAPPKLAPKWNCRTCGRFIGEPLELLYLMVEHYFKGREIEPLFKVLCPRCGRVNVLPRPFGDIIAGVAGEEP